MKNYLDIMVLLDNPRTTIGEISFNMVYGVEAVLPVEIGVEISQVQAYTLIGNEAI